MLEGYCDVKGGFEMSKDKTVFVNEETYKKVVEILGYEPSNLIANSFLPEGNSAYVVDNKQFKVSLTRTRDWFDINSF